MRRAIVAFVAALVSAPALSLAADAGTVTPVSAGPLVDTASGDSWRKVAPNAPAKFTLTGPARFQVAFRLNIPDDAHEVTPAGIVMVRFGGKPLAQFRLQPKPGKDTWKDVTGYKPSLAVGFYVEVAPGDQTYEFGLNGGGANGGAVYVIDAAKSTRPLPANAPVVAIPIAPIVAKATPTPAPTATPSLDGGSTGTPRPAADHSMLSLWLGAGGGSQTRTFVTGSAPATDLALGVRYRPIRMAELALSAGYEQTEDLVPLPGAPVDRIAESRMFAEFAPGFRLAGSQGALVLGPSVRYAGITNEEASYDVIFASAGARAEIPLGPLTASGGGEAGVPVVDGTPGSWNDGDLASRYAWNGGLRYTRRSMALSPSLGLEYRGESVTREFSTLVSHGAWLVLQAEF